MLVDLEANFQINDNLRFAVGGENIFDAFPDDDGHFIAGLLGMTLIGLHAVYRRIFY